MNTIIIENADEKLTALLKQIAEMAGVPFKTKIEHDNGIIKNPQLLQAIEDYESGKHVGKIISPDDLKSEIEKLIAKA